MKAPRVKPAAPAADELTELLGPSGDLWAGLRAGIAAIDAPIAERWVYGGSKYGWSCRLEKGRKGILYMTPDAGHFRVGMALSDAARTAVLESDLPERIRETLASAPRAMEGWPVRVSVRTATDLELVLRLAKIKLSA